MTLTTSPKTQETAVVSPDGAAPPSEQAEAPPPALVPPQMPRASRPRRIAAAVAYGVLGFVLLGLAWQFASKRPKACRGRSEARHAFEHFQRLVTDGPEGRGPLQLRDSIVRLFKGSGSPH